MTQPENVSAHLATLNPFVSLILGLLSLLLASTNLVPNNNRSSCPQSLVGHLIMIDAENQTRRTSREDADTNGQARFESLPVELIAEILSELDVASLITVSCLSRRLRSIAGDSALNPWKRLLARNFNRPDGQYEACMSTLANRWTFPRTNLPDILTCARAEFLLFESTLPHLPDTDYDEAFRRRFLPSWVRWRRDGCKWREAYMK